MKKGGYMIDLLLCMLGFVVILFDYIYGKANKDDEDYCGMGK
jgi:hypothetical protein